MTMASEANSSNGLKSSEQIAFEARRRKRSIAIAVALGLMAAMFFTATIVQLKGKIASDRFQAIKQKNVKRVQ